ncbi:MAG: iron-containing redox enzyme family protein, partial [Flavobacteriales bacterium]|nr:iron-containing redox enzyme family protein [Flavobacteriales bacterium]
MRNYIELLKDSTSLNKQAYFQRLNGGQMTKEQFVLGQLEFYHAVVHFAKPMLAVASKLASYEARWNIIENVIEEHGNGNLGDTHGATFKLFMHKMGVNEVAFGNPGVAVSEFNKVLMDVCDSQDWMKSIAMLGIIEDRFSEISGKIGEAVIERGWLAKEELVHYNTHEKLDIKHADDFYSLIDANWSNHQKEIKDGLDLGNNAFLALY